MVGGNIPGETRTISIALFDKVQTFDENAADSMAFFMLLFSLGLLILINLIGDRHFQRLK